MILEGNNFIIIDAETCNNLLDFMNDFESIKEKAKKLAKHNLSDFHGELRLYLMVKDDD